MNAAQFFDQWNPVWRDLMRAVSMLKDGQLAFKPSEHYERTVGDILRHIINVERGWIHYVIRRQYESWPQEDAATLATVEAIEAEMQLVHQSTMDYLETVDVDDFTRIVQVPDDGTPKLAWILWHVFEQEIHHRGELYLCLSLLGYDRPKTDRPG
jgi:uncharacterized damage-inducible protein DinB